MSQKEGIMITDINNQPIKPGQYKYWVKGMVPISITITVIDVNGQLHFRFDPNRHLMQLIDISSQAILERIEE